MLLEDIVHYKNSLKLCFGLEPIVYEHENEQRHYRKEKYLHTDDYQLSLMVYSIKKLKEYENCQYVFVLAHDYDEKLAYLCVDGEMNDSDLMFVFKEFDIQDLDVYEHYQKRKLNNLNELRSMVSLFLSE